MLSSDQTSPSQACCRWTRVWLLSTLMLGMLLCRHDQAWQPLRSVCAAWACHSVWGGGGGMMRQSQHLYQKRGSLHAHR
jgi:hypothetical protein